MRTNSSSTTRGATLAVAAALVATACSSASPAFDLDVLEQDVSASLAAAYEPDGYTLFGVSCPRDAEDATTGDVFACVADVERQFVRIRVEATDDLGGYEWTTLDLVLSMDDTEALVAGEMSDRLGDTIDLDCGSPNLRVLPIGASIRCEATDSGRNVVDALLTVNGPGQTAWEIIR